MASDSSWILVLQLALQWVQLTLPTLATLSSSAPTARSALQKGQEKRVSNLARDFLTGAFLLLLRLPMLAAAALCAPSRAAWTRGVRRR